MQATLDEYEHKHELHKECLGGNMVQPLPCSSTELESNVDPGADYRVVILSHAVRNRFINP